MSDVQDDQDLCWEHYKHTELQTFDKAAFITREQAEDSSNCTL